MNTVPFILLVFLSIGCLYVTVDSLRCFYCAASGHGSRCEDPDTYYKERKAWDDWYELQGIPDKDITDPKNKTRKYETPPAELKNCSAPFNDSCITEAFYDRGNTVAHIRDCSNSKIFSFSASTMANRSAYYRLESLAYAKNNETACVWDGLHVVCLSICDTDFCNGPQLDGAFKVSMGLPMTILAVLFNRFLMEM